MNSKKILVGLALLTISSVVFAQQEEGQINPNSLLNIPKYEQLYKVRVWRTVDLRERQNKGFFAKGNEITQLILNAVASGELADIYTSDTLNMKTRKTKEKFNSDMISVPGANYDPWVPTKAYYTDDYVVLNGKNYVALADNTGKNPGMFIVEWQAMFVGKAITFLPSELYRMTIQEDVIFDKRRSRLYYDILAVQFETFDANSGFLKSTGWFKYKDLEKLFRNHVNEAVWFNRYNSAQNKNYADAFLLRLFHGTIDKVENPDNDRIFDMYGSHKEAVWATEWEEMKMMEKEHNLWEY